MRHFALVSPKRQCAIATILLMGCGALPSPSARAEPVSSRPSAAQTAAPNLVTSRVTLTPCHVEGVTRELRCGVYNVFENRRTRQGRMLPLKVVVIPALHPHPDEGPVFYLTGGPGETVTELVAYYMESGAGDEQDAVMVDERGSGEGHRLDCPPIGSDDHLESYLRAPFEPAAARACRSELERHYDLSQYSTAAFVEDLDEVRQAMGYDRINIYGGSFGTHAALMYIRKYGEHVRSAYLASLVTLSNRVPLDHARAGQEGLQQLFKECEEDPSCHSAYPRLREDFAAVLAKVREKPVLAAIHHPITGATMEIPLSEPSFADAVRVMMYRSERARQLPYLIEQAKAGDFSPFAEAGVSAGRGIYTGIRVGLSLAISCNEFVARIRPEDIEPATRGSFLGSSRVRTQMAACSAWAKTDLPGNFFEPFRSQVPAVLVSGAADPVSRPRSGEEVKSFMPNAIHLVIPGGGHTPENACTRAIRTELFRTGQTRGLDLSCMTKLRPGPFKLPPQ